MKNEREREPIVIDKSPRYGVVMPYSSNIDSAGNPYLSLFSFEAVHAAYQLYRTHAIDKFVLCGETTFGKDKKSTTDMMRDMLLALNVPTKDIVITPGEDLNNTAVQLKAIAQAKKHKLLGTEPLTFITWGYHEERVKNHMKGFGIKGKTITVDSVLEQMAAYDEDFLAKIAEIYLPTERKLRNVSRFDRRGLIPRMIARTGIISPRVMDLQDGIFINTTATKRRRSFEKATVVLG